MMFTNSVYFALENFHAWTIPEHEQSEKGIREIGTNHLPTAFSLFGNM